MKIEEIEVKVNMARREMDYWKDIIKNKGCKSCQHFSSGSCDLADGATPPPEVQATGCDSWAWDCIPF